MKRKEMKQLLEERIERISLLETRIDTMEQLVDGYRAREQSIIDTLHAAKETAAKTVEDGKTHADAMLSEAKRHASEALADAQLQATAMIEEANRRAKETLASAQSESERMLQSTRETKREYEQMVVTFNTMLEQNAVEAEQSASRYAEFIKERKITSPKISPEEGGRYSGTAAARADTLPDPKGDPARLMQNIYHLQNRPIPEGVRQDQYAQADTAAKETPAESANAAAEPLPRYARTSEPPQSTDTRPATHAFGKENDAAQPGEAYGRAPDNKPQNEEPEPFSEKAWGSEEHQSPKEPQAEFTTAFDTGYPETDFSLMPDPACMAQDSATEKAAEPAQAFTPANETQTVPESDFNVDETAEYAANYEAKFEDAVNAADDGPREWEPDVEAEAGEVPSVGELLPDSGSGNGDDVSLDDLLDEIIKAGE